MPRILSDDQTAAFDYSGWDQPRFEQWMRLAEIEALLSPYLARLGEARFLDLGGGTGRLADTLLARHPSSHAVVADNAQALLARNQQHPRKTVQRVEASRLAEAFGAQSFDVIFVHRLLHHVVGGSYGGSLRLIQGVLEQCATILRPCGRLSIIENIWQGWPIEGLAGRLLYCATSSRVAAPVARRLGSNTAGTGVCYLSEPLLNRFLSRAGLEVETRQVFAVHRWPWYIRYPTLLREARALHYWCKPEGA
jgi:SAM-dependent methyltransferase